MQREKTILFVEDTLMLLQEFPFTLRRKGYRVLTASAPDEAMGYIRQGGIDLALIDLQLPVRDSAEFSAAESAGGNKAGLLLARELRRRSPETPIVFWSGRRDRDLRAEVLEVGRCRLIPKQGAYGIKAVLDSIEELLGDASERVRPKTFIVHGHDEETMSEVRAFLVNDMRFPEPTIVRDEPSHARTIIEKIEDYGEEIDVVVVLLTPDDRIVESGPSASPAFQARQNVIFELGYFLGYLGRGTGQVVMLYKRPIALPSDIVGVMGIDITNGVEPVADEIRRELIEWL